MTTEKKTIALTRQTFVGKVMSLLFNMLSQVSRSVMSDTLWPHEPQHTSPPCSSPTPGVHSNPSSLSQWCHLTISSSVVPFSSQLQSFQSQILHSLKIGHRKSRMNFPHFTWCSLFKRLWICWIFLNTCCHVVSSFFAWHWKYKKSV